MTIRSYRDLLVWQRAIQLVEECYRLTTEFPRSEEFGLKTQMRRAAISIPSNIAEGNSRHHTLEYCQFLSVALGSLAEIETQIELACRLNYVKKSDTQALNASCSEVGRMLHGLRTSISRGPRR